MGAAGQLPAIAWFQALPSSLAQPKGFAASNFSYWVTSDMAGLEKLTNRGAQPQPGGGQAQPTLWPLPSSLMALTEARRADCWSQLLFPIGKVMRHSPAWRRLVVKGIGWRAAAKAWVEACPLPAAAEPPGCQLLGRHVRCHPVEKVTRAKPFG